VAIYRCQAPNPDCDCPACQRERWLERHPEAKRALRKPPEPIRIDKRGLKWYPLNVPEDQMR